MRQALNPILRGVKTSLFLLTVLCVSMVLNVSHSRPASAESLLYGLTCTVTGLLGSQCETKMAPPQEEPEETPGKSGGETNNGSSGGGAAGNSGNSSKNSPAVVPEPIVLEEELLEELPTVASVSTASRSYTFPAHVAPLTQSYDGAEVLGQAVTAPIESGESGWKILGISWAWWLVAAMFLAGGIYLTGKRAVLRNASEVAK
jgi:hypothetical protein